MCVRIDRKIGAGFCQSPKSEYANVCQFQDELFESVFTLSSIGGSVDVL